MKLRFLLCPCGAGHWVWEDEARQTDWIPFVKRWWEQKEFYTLKNPKI